MTASLQPHFIVRGWHVLAGLIAFFGVVIGVNVVFVVAALNTFPGEDVTHPYLQGLEYNQTIAARRAQSALGWRAFASLHRASEGAVLSIELRDRAQAALPDLKLEGALRWATDSRRDRTLAFHQVAPGRFEAVLGALPEGDWQLRARAMRGSEALDFEADLTWPTAQQ